MFSAGKTPTWINNAAIFTKRIFIGKGYDDHKLYVQLMDAYDVVPFNNLIKNAQPEKDENIKLQWTLKPGVDKEKQKVNKGDYVIQGKNVNGEVVYFSEDTDYYIVDNNKEIESNVQLEKVTLAKFSPSEGFLQNNSALKLPFDDTGILNNKDTLLEINYLSLKEWREKGGRPTADVNIDFTEVGKTDKGKTMIQVGKEFYIDKGEGIMAGITIISQPEDNKYDEVQCEFISLNGLDQFPQALPWDGPNNNHDIPKVNNLYVYCSDGPYQPAPKCPNPNNVDAAALYQSELATLGWSETSYTIVKKLRDGFNKDIANNYKKPEDFIALNIKSPEGVFLGSGYGSGSGSGSSPEYPPEIKSIQSSVANWGVIYDISTDDDGTRCCDENCDVSRKVIKPSYLHEVQVMVENVQNIRGRKVLDQIFLHFLN